MMPALVLVWPLSTFPFSFKLISDSVQLLSCMNSGAKVEANKNSTDMLFNKSNLTTLD